MKKTTGKKKFALMCKMFGRKFSFNAGDFAEANDMMLRWIHYHHFEPDKENFYVVLLLDSDTRDDLHNEYF